MLSASKLDKSYNELSNLARDKQGYINLGSVDINLDSNSREKVGNIFRDKNWVEFSDGKVMLLKEECIIDDERNATVYSELIMEQLAKQAGIECASYDLYKRDGKYGVLSEYCLKEDEEMFSFDSLVGNGADSEFSKESFDAIKLQENIIDFLFSEGLSKSEIKKILVDFQKRMVFDIFTLNTDRHTENISFRRKVVGNEVKFDIAPMYDNENCLLLDMDYSTINSLLFSKSAIKQTTNMIAPKIAIIDDEEQMNNEIWINTLDEYCEIEEVRQYARYLYENLNIDKAVASVEEKISAKVPEDVRKIASLALECRKKEIDKVLCFEEISLT